MSFRVACYDIWIECHTVDEVAELLKTMECNAVTPAGPQTEKGKGTKRERRGGVVTRYSKAVAISVPASGLYGFFCGRFYPFPWSLLIGFIAGILLGVTGLGILDAIEERRSRNPSGNAKPE